MLLGTFAPREDVEHFVEDLFFCCLIGATCAHAKNYALLFGSENVAFLSPLYDVASMLGCSEMRRKARLAMSIRGEMRLGRMGRQALERLAAAGKLEELGPDVSWCISPMQNIGKKIPAKEASLFDELACIPGMEELRAHLEAPRVENVSSILACIES
ncbi:HipA domain-containing protein [Olsenella sp. YH-ols2221]|uniref:HipA domain-containing protein n=1 Tax=Olsenella kribbiana TaxID=3115221 RepID=UPI002ED99B9F